MPTTVSQEKKSMKTLILTLLAIGSVARAEDSNVIGFSGTCDYESHGSPVLDLSVREQYQYADFKIRQKSL